MRSVRLRVAMLAGAGVLSALTVVACDSSAYAQDSAAPRPPAGDKPTCTYLDPF
jgi:hypothetical protein